MTTIAMAVWAVMQVLLPIIINHGAPPTVGNAVQEPVNTIGWPEVASCNDANPDDSNVPLFITGKGMDLCNVDYAYAPFTPGSAGWASLIAFEDGSYRMDILPSGQTVGECAFPEMGCSIPIPDYPGDIEQAISDAVGIGPAIPNAWGHGEGWTDFTVVAYDEYDYPMVRRWTVAVNVCRNMNCDIVTVYLTPQ